SSASVTQSFNFTPATTVQAKEALQEGFVLWPGAVPPGTNGHAKMGDNWQVQQLISHGGTPFTSPPLDALRIFDMLDPRFTPNDAIDWMHANGYPDAGVFFTTANGVFGFDFMYMSFNPDAGGTWDLMLRSE